MAFWEKRWPHKFILNLTGLKDTKFKDLRRYLLKIQKHFSCQKIFHPIVRGKLLNLLNKLNRSSSPKEWTDWIPRYLSKTPLKNVFAMQELWVQEFDQVRKPKPSEKHVLFSRKKYKFPLILSSLLKKCIQCSMAWK